MALLRTIAHLPPLLSPFPSSSSSSKPGSSSSIRLQPPRVSHHTLTDNNKKKRKPIKIKAVDESQTNSETETEAAESQPAVKLTELGQEIKKAMEERKEKEKEKDGVGNLFSGVAEEVKEIEWPVFGKVLGITGVVFGVIAGSSVVLLTVNAVLAELSDRVFAGRGVQDFFG